MDMYCTCTVQYLIEGKLRFHSLRGFLSLTHPHTLSLIFLFFFAYRYTLQYSKTKTRAICMHHHKIRPVSLKTGTGGGVEVRK